MHKWRPEAKAARIALEMPVGFCPWTGREDKRGLPADPRAREIIDIAFTRARNYDPAATEEDVIRDLVVDVNQACGRAEAVRLHELPPFGVGRAGQFSRERAKGQVPQIEITSPEN